MSGTNHATVSISRAAYDQIAAAAKARGVAIAELVRQALDGTFVEVDAPAVPVTLASYVAIGKVARAQRRTFSDVLEVAIVRALDDAERFPVRPRRTCKHPRVAHASRRAA
jgi:hypothetical protein